MVFQRIWTAIVVSTLLIFESVMSEEGARGSSWNTSGAVARPVADKPLEAVEGPSEVAVTLAAVVTTVI